MDELKIEYLPVDALKPYERNTKIHRAADVKKIEESIRRYGFDDPIGIWGEDNLIVEGHGRLQAAKRLGMETVPVIRLDHLSDQERREYAIVHNKTVELSAWDYENLQAEVPKLDLSGFEFEWPKHFWGEKELADNDEYDEFLEKFEAKKTTDDCYTPPLVYDAVRDFAVRYFGLEGRQIVRPFFPGADYTTEEYPEGCVVIDNPPFSIVSEIVRFYMKNKIDFFLFAPGLTLFSIASGTAKYFPVAASVTYENGARVNTGFVTNMGEYKIDTEPELWRAVTYANKLSQMKPEEAQLPVYEYPDELLSSARFKAYAERGVDVKIKNAVFCRELESQKEAGKAIYGGGFLCSSENARKIREAKMNAERIAIELEKVESKKTVWPLSERERAIVDSLGAKP